MAENNHLENRTMQLAKRVESLLNNLPEQGESLEARKLKHVTSFNDSLAKELGSFKAEYQEKLSSISEKETAAARALDDAVEKSRVLSEETEQLRKEAEALQKNHTENSKLSKKLEDMISSASSERHSLEKEREAIGSRATELTKREEDLRAGLEQLGGDRTAGLYELEQGRIAHENRVKEDDARIQQQSEELEQSRLAHDETAREDLTRIRERSRQLDVKEDELNSKSEEIALQKQGISKELRKLENDKNRLSTQSAEVTQRQRSLEAREKTLETREERLQALQKKVTDSENQCKEFVTAHNSQVDLFEKTCADYMNKQKQIDNEKAKVSTKDGIITAIKAQLGEERQAVKDLRAQLSKAESELTAKNARVETLRHAEAEKGKELGEILELLRAMDMSGSTMDSTINVIRESTESVKKLEGELSSKLKASDAVERNLAAAHNDIDRLNKDVASRDETIARLKEQKETMEQSAREADTELAKLRAQIQDKTSELSTRDAHLDSLKRELEGEAEKVKDLAHTRSKYNLQEERYKQETETLQTQHAIEIKRLEEELRRAAPPRGHQPPTPMTSSTGRSQCSEEDRCLEWQKLLAFAEQSKSRLVEDEQTLELLWTLEPSIVPESQGQVNIQNVFLNLAKVANNPQKRGAFEKYLDEAPPGWYCFGLVTKYGHEDQDAADSNKCCRYPRHSENCLQVRTGHGDRGVMDFRNKIAPG